MRSSSIQTLCKPGSQEGLKEKRTKHWPLGHQSQRLSDNSCCARENRNLTIEGVRHGGCVQAGRRSRSIGICTAGMSRCPHPMMRDRELRNPHGKRQGGVVHASWSVGELPCRGSARFRQGTCNICTVAHGASIGPVRRGEWAAQSAGATSGAYVDGRRSRSVSVAHDGKRPWHANLRCWKRPAYAEHQHP